MNQYRLYHRDSGTWSKKLFTMFQMLQHGLPADTIICRAGSEHVQTLAELLSQGNTPVLLPATPPCKTVAETATARPSPASSAAESPDRAAAADAGKRETARLQRLAYSLFIGTWVMAAGSSAMAAVFLLIGSQCVPSVSWSAWLLTGALAGIPAAALCLRRILIP